MQKGYTESCRLKRKCDAAWFVMWGWTLLKEWIFFFFGIKGITTIVTREAESLHFLAHVIIKNELNSCKLNVNGLSLSAVVLAWFELFTDNKNGNKQGSLVLVQIVRPKPVLHYAITMAFLITSSHAIDDPNIFLAELYTRLCAIMCFSS